MSPQNLLMPGASAPAPTVRGANQAYAPVVQANDGTSGSTLKRLFKEFAGPAVREIGKAVVDSITGQQSDWQQSDWQQW